MIQLLIAILLFLPTTALVGSEVYLIFPVLAFVMHRKQLIAGFTDFRSSMFAWKYIRLVWLPFIILSGIGIYSLIGGQSILDVATGPVVLFPVTLLAAYVVSDKKVIQFLLLLIALEVLIGCSQYLVGTNTYFKSSPLWFDFINYKSLYHTRVFGISDNSSYLSQKAIVGILLLFFTKPGIKPWQSAVLYTMFVLGIITTFGRTTIVVFGFSILVYVFVQIFNWIWKRSVITNNDKVMNGMVVTTLGVFFSTFSFWKFQFTRLDMIPRTLLDGEGADLLRRLGLGGLEMAGRKELWSKAIEFIQGHFWFGNWSQRFLVDGKHVHNSFLEFLSTHGIFLFMLMLFFIWFNMTKKNIWIIACLSLYSVGQYGIFWDISFLDILFFSLLLFGIQFQKDHKS